MIKHLVFVCMAFFLGLSVNAQDTDEEVSLEDELELDQETPAPTPTPVPQPKRKAVAAKPKRKVAKPHVEKVRARFAVGYSTADKVKFSKVSYSGAATGTGFYEADLTSAPYISIGAAYMPKNKFGGEVKLVYEFERDLERSTFSINGTTFYSILSPKPALQVTTLEFNSLYRFNYLYLPFGVSYSIPKYTETNPSSATNIKSSIGGYQVGVGYFTDKNLTITAYYKAVALKATESDAGVNADLGTGYIEGVVLEVGYLF